jgi:hypothetical protein
MRERELFVWSEFLCVQIGTSSIEGYVDSIFIALWVRSFFRKAFFKKIVVPPPLHTGGSNKKFNN